MRKSTSEYATRAEMSGSRPNGYSALDRLIYPSQQNLSFSSILPRTYAAISFRHSRLYTLVRGLSMSADDAVYRWIPHSSLVSPSHRPLRS